jgi:hypothetical protein
MDVMDLIDDMNISLTDTVKEAKNQRLTPVKWSKCQG